MSEKNNRGKHRYERSHDLAVTNYRLEKMRWELIQVLKYIAIASSFFALGIFMGMMI